MTQASFTAERRGAVHSGEPREGKVPSAKEQAAKRRLTTLYVHIVNLLKTEIPNPRKIQIIKTAMQSFTVWEALPSDVKRLQITISRSASGSVHSLVLKRPKEIPGLELDTHYEPYWSLEDLGDYLGVEVTR